MCRRVRAAAASLQRVLAAAAAGPLEPLEAIRSRAEEEEEEEEAAAAPP